ncbi:MAG: PQQ-binding-like beta-propeller repeat protein [Planctomycetota bacterium]|nr:PQQ-binding-like beta-propeller repeat protein [Planctomycetota bacterium]
MQILLLTIQLALIGQVGQIGPGGRQAPDSPIFIDSDREAARLLRRAAQLEEEERWDQVARLYDELLGHPRSVELLFEVGEGHYRGVREFCRQTILALPPEGLAAYRARIDPDARAVLARAREEGDLGGARQVVDRYPGSTMIPEALAWISAYATDHGRFVDAAWAISRQLQAEGLPSEERSSLSLRLGLCFVHLGDRPACRAIRDRLRKEGTGPIRFGGDEIDPVEWLDSILGPAPTGERELRGGPPPGAGSWKLLWAHEISDYYKKGDRSPPPLIHPIVREGSVFFHDGNHAFRLEQGTGRLRWKLQVRPGSFSYRLPASECTIAYGDGRLFTNPQGNAIVAIDEESGDFLWRKEVEEIREELDIGSPVKLSGSMATFEGTVYSAATSMHAEKEVYLIALDGATGKALWSRFIAARTASKKVGANLFQSGMRLYLVSDIGIAAAIDLPGGNLRWLRTRDRSLGRPSIIVSASRVHLLFPRSSMRQEADHASGEIRHKSPVGDVDRLVGLLGDKLCALGPRGLYLLDTLRPRHLWSAEGVGTLQCVFDDGGAVVPAAIGLVRVDALGKTDVLTGWSRGELGNLVASDQMVISSTSRGIFAYGVGGGATEALPEGLAIDELVSTLGDPSWERRDEADRRLREMRPGAIPEIASGRDSSSAETRWRAGEITYTIARRLRIAAWQERLHATLMEREPEILLQLTHRDPAVRMEGLETLSSEGGTQVVPVLRDLLADRDAEIRFGAARGLLLQKDRSGMEVIRRNLASVAPEQRRLALETLDDYGQRDDGTLIRPLLSDNVDRVRLAAVRAYIARLGKDAIEVEGMALLDDSYESIRMEVIVKARELGGRNVAELHRKAMADKSDAVRAEAFVGLEKYFDADTAELVGRALMDDSPTISNRAAELLHRMVTKYPNRVGLIPIDPLRRAIESDSEQLRFEVVQILERMRSGVATRALAAAARDENSQIRRRALRALRDLAYDKKVAREDVPVLCELMDLETGEARHSVLRILYEFPGPAVDRVFVETMGDPDIRLRKVARQGVVGRIKPGLVVMLLEASLVEGDPAAEPARDLLGSLSNKVGIPGLIRGLESGGLEIRSEAVRLLREKARTEMGFDPAAEDRSGALRKWKSWAFQWRNPGVSVEKILQGLGDPKPRGRYQAARQAAEIVDDRLVGALIQRLGEERVRWVLDMQVEALRKASGQSFGYDRKSSREERAAAIARWVAWWDEQQP